MNIQSKDGQTALVVVVGAGDEEIIDTITISGICVKTFFF